jgi:MFS superfamily sulfate permease-like transporter
VAEPVAEPVAEHDAPPSRTARAQGKGALRADILSGFLVFLIALPLCLGISMASGFPPIAGVFTAIIGGVIGSLISNSALTIKGPAAGLIVIALGAVQELGQGDLARGYKLALGVCVVAGVIQILFGLLRTGILGELFPSAAVHGMLAAIGIIICSKQLHTLLGVEPVAKAPLGLLAEVPHSLGRLNPEVAVIGGISLLILFGMPRLPWAAVRRIPAPMVVLLVAVPLARLFDLSHEHVYTVFHHDYLVNAKYLVQVPANLLSAVTSPSFAGVLTPVGIKYVVMFALVGSLESLLSAKAIDLLDPLRRRTDMNRDLLAIGVGNTLAAMVGGLPMISEIVRSSANLNNGARSRLANLFHGLFLLGFVALLPHLLQQVPLAALAAMLVYTGLRLASPKEFVHTYQVGRDEFIVFLTTIVATLATDLLIGIAAGMAMGLLLCVLRGIPVGLLLPPRLNIAQRGDGEYVVAVLGAAVFGNWLSLRRRILELQDARRVVLDLSQTALIDHTVMVKLAQLQSDFSEGGRQLELTGIDRHASLSRHPMAARVLPRAR